MKIKLIKSMPHKFAVILCLIFVSSNAIASNKNAVCFVKPFDLSPENRINVLTEKGIAVIMHVKKDGKTFQSSPVVREIEMVKQVKNMTAHRLDDGSIIAIDYITGLSIFYKPPIEKGGVQYDCQEVSLAPVK